MAAKRDLRCVISAYGLWGASCPGRGVVDINHGANCPGPGTAGWAARYTVAEHIMLGGTAALQLACLEYEIEA
jgi:hypothetical protein